MNFFLPHIGELNFKTKAFYLGYIVKRLLDVYTGQEKPTDRDSYEFKRISVTGKLIHDLFSEYYFTDFTISLINYDIYGSLFLKLKYTASEIAKNYDYILFENSNYYNHEIVLKNFDNYTDPHSDYFGALANYGILGFLIFLGFPIFIVLNYLRNFKKTKIYKDSFIYFLIIVMIFIEAIIIDIFHVQFIWIIFAMHLLGSDNNKITHKVE